MRINIHPAVPTEKAKTMARGLGLKLFDDGTPRFMWKPAPVNIAAKLCTLIRHASVGWDGPDAA